MNTHIAVNTQHTGNRQRDNRGYAETWSSEQLDKLLHEGWLREMVASIRDGNVRLKERLPYLCPHYWAFRNNHRAQADIIPEAFTFMTCVDVDDLEMVDKAVKRALELNGDEGDWQDHVLRIAYSARRKVHIYIRMPKGMTIEETQRAFCREIEVPYDESCTTPERFIFITGIDEEVFRSEHWLEPITDRELEERREAFLMRGLDVDGRKLVKGGETLRQAERTDGKKEAAMEYHGIPYSRIVEEWLEGRTVKPGDRHRTSLMLADHLRYITDNDSALIERILRATPFVAEIVAERGENVAATVQSAQKYDFLHNTPKRMQQAIRRAGGFEEDAAEAEESFAEEPTATLPRFPLGVRDSVAAVGPQLAMPVLTAICPCIGTLATGVRLDVHGQKRGLNLISYIVGDFASGKGKIDPVVEAWMAELAELDKMYQTQEDEWRAKKRAAKNKKEQPEEPKLPVRCLTLNNTVANLAERLANTEGRHAFSFTPEADTVAQKWKQSMSDFSVMLRQSYDGSRYDREARSAEAVNVHIDHLLWNVTMCGTPDALYRVVTNYTDGFQSRIALARTPDNTFAPLEDKPSVISPQQTDHIRQVAHLLPLMQGEVTLPKLETKGREWLERIRLETMKNDDKVRARQRFRVCVTAQRMTCCLMLCKVCETLIHKHGFNGAETLLKQKPSLWRELLLKSQTPALLETFNIIADSLIENALFFFRERIENALCSRDYSCHQNGERIRRGRNDSIYERLDLHFTFEQAMQQSVAVKGVGVTHNSVRLMLKNWRNQGLVIPEENGRFRKLTT